MIGIILRQLVQYYLIGTNFFLQRFQILCTTHILECVVCLVGGMDDGIFLNS